jgi:hypothetical protein
MTSTEPSSEDQFTLLLEVSGDKRGPADLPSVEPASYSASTSTRGWVGSEGLMPLPVLEPTRMSDPA